MRCSDRLYRAGAQDDAQALLREAAEQLEANAPAMPLGADGGAPSKARATTRLHPSGLAACGWASA